MLATTFLGYTIGGVFWILGMVFWIALALLPATIAKSKGHSFIAWFFLSLFFWWITLFVTLFMHDNRDRPTSSHVV